jgi:hypothetical protein
MRVADDLGLQPEVIEVFDELYGLVLGQRPLEQPFVDRLNETNETLSERIAEAVKLVTQAHLERKRFMEQRRRLAREAREHDERTGET